MRWPDPALNDITNREELARYLRDLAARVRDDTLPVENPATGDFLDAAGRWTRSMDAFFANVVEEPVPEKPDWAMVAAIFRAALTYE